MLSKKKYGIAVKFILVSLMSLSICQSLYTSLFMTKMLSLTMLIAVVPFALLFFLMFANRITSIVSGSVLCISAAAGMFYAITAGSWLSDYLSWFIDLCNGFNDTLQTHYATLTVIIITFIVTLLIFLFTVKFYNFYVISLMLFSVFFVQLQLRIFVSNIAFILFLFSFLLYYFFDVLRRRSKVVSYDAGNRLNYLLCILPVCLIILAVSSILPSKATRTALPWLDVRFDSAVNRIVEYFSNKDLSDFDYFSIDAAGFGKDDRLGGNIDLSKVHVMDVKSEYSNLYLKATSKAFYDGHKWYDDDKQFIPLGKERTYYSDYVRLDCDEFLNFPGMEYNQKENFYKHAKAEINFVDLNTKSLFIPSKISSLLFKSPISLLFDAEQMLSSNKTQKKGFEYTVEYNNLKLNSQELKASLRLSHKGYYEDTINNSTSATIFIPSGDEMIITDKAPLSFGKDSAASASVLNEKAKAIYKRYTQLPDTVTARVRKLAADITKDAANTYDTCKAVETYLAENYPYTLKPGTPPRKRDFVDYFLFDGNKGYCTYYASAMTVLLRCLDIPARYVEGYILPPVTNKKGVFEVTSQQAHAWVEVYFEGFGWIPFEPTAPFAANLYSDKTISATVTVDMQGSAYSDYMDMINKYRNNNARVSYEIKNNNITDESKASTYFAAIIKIVLSLLLILFAFIILVSVNKLKFYYTIRKIKKADPNNSVLLAYSYILKVLKILNISLNAGETPTDFGKRVEKTLNFSGYSFNKTDFNLITDAFIKARYSRALLPEGARQDMLNFINILLKSVKDSIGKIKFFIARYILGKM